MLQNLQTNRAAIPTGFAPNAPVSQRGRFAPNVPNAPTEARNHFAPNLQRRTQAIPTATPKPAPRRPRPVARPQYNKNLLQQYIQQAQKSKPVRKRQPAYGQEGWINPEYNPQRNSGGYTRFDYTKPGSGLERARTYQDGARIFDAYAKLKPGRPGYTHANYARNYLRDTFGVAPNKATDLQKFEAMDMAMRSVQKKNRRPKRKFGVGSALGLLGGAALTLGGASIPARAAWAAGSRLIK